MKLFKLCILGIIFLVAVILLIPNQVSAATVKVDTVEELKTALADDTVTDIKIEATIQINASVDIDGNGKTVVSEVKKAFEVYSGTVNFSNIIIENPVANGRCIDIRDGGLELTLNNVTLKTTNNSTNNQTLNVGGNFTQPAIINVNNSTILAGNAGYGIITFNPVKLTIDNSKITGYAALYMKGPDSSTGSKGSKVTIQNGSVLTGVNNFSAGTPEKPTNNGFGTIVFEDGNITVDVKKSEIIAEGTGTASQVPFGEKANLQIDTNEITVFEGSKVTTGNSIVGVPTTSNTTITFKPGSTANVEIPEKLLEKGTTTKLVDNKYIVGTERKINVEVTEGGTVESNTKTAIEGETITLTVKADEGYKLKSLTANGVEIKDEKFVMLDEDVTVKAVFEKLVEETKKEEAKDETPKMGVDSTTLTVFSVIAAISLGALIVLKKDRK